MFLPVAACAPFDKDWTPTVDIAKDPHADTLKADMDQCRQLAYDAGHQAASPRTRTLQYTDDGVSISKAVYQRAFTNCLKERKHPVIN
jgi:hypothetical protein